ncbi:MAG: CoA-binding protein [Chloroflexi bacterium]|nr:CoA-binding protein [Chloroflexota bacterium]
MSRARKRKALDPIKKIFEEYKTIAVVGASDNPARPAYDVAAYLRRSGFRVIPVNPRLTQLWGEKCYPDLLSIPESIDVVDIFRNPQFVPAVVEQAILKKAKVVWMQPGAENSDAAARAEQAGLDVVMGLCMMTAYPHASSAST